MSTPWHIADPQDWADLHGETRESLANDIKEEAERDEDGDE